MGVRLTFLHLRVLFDVCSARYLAPHDKIFLPRVDGMAPDMPHNPLPAVQSKFFFGGGSERCLKWGGQPGGTSI